MNSAGARAFLIFITLLALLQLFQQFFHPIKLAGLQGAFEKGNQPSFTSELWFDGKFQQQYDHYLKYNTAFNGELVRLRNQVDYSVFGNINTILTLGKADYIFDPNYIAAINGVDTISDSLKLEKIKAISTTVSVLRSFNVPLIVIFTPNKAGYYSEYLNEKLSLSQPTNRHFFKHFLAGKNIPFLDFHEWFMQLKDTATYPLIPKYGAHWSTYGAWLAADSLFHFLQKSSTETLTGFSLKELTLSTKARFTDDDYLASLNLMKKWESPQMAYPVLKFTPGKKPDVLVISDSFIWSLYDLEIFQKCFSENSVVRYYNKTLFDNNKNNKGPVVEISKQDFQNRDYVIIISSDPSLRDFGFGFFESVSKSISR